MSQVKAQNTIDINEIIWHRELADVEIPNVPLVGQVARQPFQLNRAELTGNLLRLRHARGNQFDQEFLISLPLTPEETLDGKKYEVSPNDLLANNPVVSLRYRLKEDKIPTGGDLYYNLFALKLHFSEPKEGRIQVAIYLCLPDKSYIAGKFMAKIKEVNESIEAA